MGYGLNNHYGETVKPFGGEAIAGKECVKNDCGSYRIGRFVFKPKKRMLSIGEKHTHLTPKESELLALLHSHANDILTRDVALKAIWSYCSHFTARSMDVYNLSSYYHASLSQY